MSKRMNTLFVAWQSPTDRSWFTVGELCSHFGRFRFDYTRGALQARDSGFRPFSAFPDLYVTYESDRLFPFFGNRLLSKGRREYDDFVRWVSNHERITDPVALLAASGGTRVTDSLELFPKPEKDDRGHYHIHFFARGLSYQPAAAARRAEELKSGDQLLIMKDVQNPSDNRALMLRTDGQYERDVYFMGYFPRYLAGDISPVLDEARFAPVKVLRVNMPPAPIQYRIMCCFQIHPPNGEEFFVGEEFKAIGSIDQLPRPRRQVSRRRD